MLIKHKTRKPFRKIRSGLLNIFGGGIMARSAAIFILSAGAIISLSAISAQTGFSARVGRLAASKNYMVPLNYVKGLFARPEHIDIHLKDMALKQIAYDRYVAFQKGYLLSGDRHEVKALVRYKDKMLNAKLRLKGYMADHWSGDRWSFRIDVKDGVVLGMKKFSIQHPGTREGLNEWYYKKLLEDEGLIYQRYDFVDVSINGKHMGVYAIEEHFGKIMIENSRRREGPILYFNDAHLWASVVRAGMGNFYDYSQEAYQEADIDGYLSRSEEANQAFMRDFARARDMLELFRTGRIAASDIFDIKKTARLFAVAELCGSSHTHEYHNVKFYFNPVTSLLEPIGSDVGDFRIIDHLAGSAEKSKREDFFSTWEARLFEDRIFFKEYVEALEEISREEYLDDFFRKTGPEAGKKLAVIYKSYPWYRFTGKSILYKNQKFIRNALDPLAGIKAYSAEPMQADRKLTLLLGNIQTMPVEVIGAVYKNSVTFSPAGETFLGGKKKSIPVDYQTVIFSIPDNFKGETVSAADIKVRYRIPGASNVRDEVVSVWPHTFTSPVSGGGCDEIKKRPNVSDFDCLTVDEDSKSIIFKPGEWAIKTDMIIPQGYKVAAGEGIKLNLSNSASIVSYSSVSFCGSADKPILVYSGDSTGQGFVVMNAEERSFLRHVNFDNLSNPTSYNPMISGAVTFYESPVSITDCKFTNNRGGDDLLNIIRTDFEFSRLLFANTAHDAFDGDFTSGRIKDTIFINCGNDAIDVSGSSVDIEGVSIDKAGDKGLSIGEASSVNARSIAIKNAKTAAASKDRSELVIDRADISDCGQGFAVYQKKDEFGPACMKATGGRMERVKTPYSVQAGSILTVDGKEIAASADKEETAS